MKSPVFSWYQLGPDRGLEDLSPEQLQRLRLTNRFRRNFAKNVQKIIIARNRDRLICERRKNLLGEIENSSQPELVKEILSLVVKIIFTLTRIINGTAPGGRYAYKKCSE
jgi:hypothetical protein